MTIYEDTPENRERLVADMQARVPHWQRTPVAQLGMDCVLVANNGKLGWVLACDVGPSVFVVAVAMPTKRQCDRVDLPYHDYIKAYRTGP